MQHLVNISIDDVSPHPQSSVGVLNSCYKILQEFPNCKFTLFVPLAYWRTMKVPYATKVPLEIDKVPGFCDVLRSLNKDNFEIGYHGYYHGIPGKSDNDEMRSLSFDEMKLLLQKMKKTVKDAGCEHVFKKILRPPAWRMSPSAIEACKNEIDILALSPEKYKDGSLNYGGKDVEFKNVVYFNVCPPSKPLALHNKTEIVYHACEWDKNYLGDKLTNELLVFLRKNKDIINFTFMDEMING
tara:strand:+ start:985 stop:1707 length:723 start_codon:yes stop_codon:yes gene_type:complete